MRVAFFLYSLGGGGAERVTATLASHWATRGWDVWVITLASEERDHYPLHPAVKRVPLGLAFESHSAFAGLIANARRILALRRTLRRIAPDVAIAMMWRANVLLAVASRGLPRLTRVGSERVHPPRLAIGRPWDQLRKRAYGWLDLVVAQTEASRAWIARETAARRVLAIPNPLAWPLPRHEPIREPSSVGHPARRRLLAVGRLDRQKGFDLLIEAFRQALISAPDWELVIVGEGAERAALEGQIRAAGLSDIAILAGAVGNIGDWYAQADLFVLSSRFEGFPNVLVEAMASGLPTVSFDCETGPGEIVRDGVDGLLVPSGDTAALALTLARLMKDPEARAGLAHGANAIRERLAVASVARAWENAILAGESVEA